MRLPFIMLFSLSSTSVASAQPPKSLDPRLEIVQFAASPDIVHPIAVDFDSKGRLLVVESHTHFRPKGYKGPEHDRIRIVEDTDGDGKADKFTTFYEGTKATMDLAVHPDGSVYVATRNEILRLRDTKGTGKADEVTRIAFLETKGDYPHNGLSGLCFDFKGDLYFGLGENLGESYSLKGADGTTLKGGGEGGNIYWCTADGKNLRRVATGFWNPFGICRDVYGRIFAVDNDPDSRPPCRLVHVVEGGDYGYQFRYGRSGRHPFQAWNGELPGTLPYVAGVGEAPCEVLAYESDGLPKDYLGTLLVTSWGDHRLECFPLEAKGASFTAKKKVVIQGGPNFRPVGLAVAPDGSLFLSDWVRRDYNLHGQGAIWQVRMKDRQREQKKSPSDVWSNRLAVRGWESFRIAKLGKGFDSLQKQAIDADPRVRALAIQAIYLGGQELDCHQIALHDPALEVRVLAATIDANHEPQTLRQSADASMRAAAFGGGAWGGTLLQRRCKESEQDYATLLDALEGADPFMRHAAIKHLVDAGRESLRETKVLTERQQVGMFLVDRHRRGFGAERISKFLESPIDDIRFLTAKWISDEIIKEAREPLEKAMKDPNVNSRLFLAYATALARINGEPVSEAKLADMFLRRARDEKASPASRVAALRMAPASFKGLQTDELIRWSADPSPEMRLEAVRALNERSDPKRTAALTAIAKGKEEALRREAMVGLADQPNAELFLSLLADNPDDALRGLVNVPLKDDAKATLETLVNKPAVDRVFGRPIRTKTEQAADVDEWLKRLEGTGRLESLPHKGDPDAGRRIFFHPRVGTCAKCHRVDGRGKDVGPDLSTIGQRDKKFILESILFPSREVAPQFQTWQVETADGKVRNGLLVGTDVDQATYVDEKGQRFTVSVHESEARPVAASIMPDGLAAQLTDQELRDLLAYLTSRK